MNGSECVIGTFLVHNFKKNLLYFSSNDAKELAVMCKKLERENGELKDGLSRVTRLETLLAYSRKTTEGLRKRCRGSF